MTDFAKAYTFQTPTDPDNQTAFSPEVCANMNTYPDTDGAKLDNTIQVTDLRGNGQTYNIRKMQDNHCWMIDNLKLAPTTPTSNLPLDSTNTNLSTGSTFTLGGEVHDAASHANGICDGSGMASGAYLTCDGQPTQNIDNSPFSAYTDDTQYGTSPSADYGYLYNWYTASAGTSWSGQQDGSGDIMPGDICPIGMHIPTGGDNGELAMLSGMMAGDGGASATNDQAHTDNWLPDGAWQGQYGGNYRGNFEIQNSTGRYWSSSITNSSESRNLTFIGSQIYPGILSNYRYNGNTIRCMLN
jgi:uncharacterized protein (TIGR02145 family)